jgi:hypothetical protein
MGLRVSPKPDRAVPNTPAMTPLKAKETYVSKTRDNQDERRRSSKSIVLRAGAGDANQEGRV